MSARKFTFHYVSIKSLTRCRILRGAKKFTFHYVSIKSDVAKDLTFAASEIYIPLCFY